jgi:N,N-dimethylformamidase beta subunit-like, C-terminal
MRRSTALPLLPAVAAAAFVAPAGAGGAPTSSPKAPIIVGAGPVVEASDVVSGGFRRITFSPDGDGRDDVATIRVRAIKGHLLSLWLHPASRTPTYLRLGKAAAGITTIHWNGLLPDGSRYPDGSYALRVCDTVTNRCSTGRVLAHLRVITMWVRRDTGVSVGETLQVAIDTDRQGPFTLDLVSPADPAGAGVGTAEIAHAGRVSYRVPAVRHGGLWLLRIRSGPAITHFPLVVHQPTLQLDAPPPHTALVVYPYLTWRAYDMFDENRDAVVDSWYAHPHDPVVPLYGPFEPPAKDPVLEGREPNPESQGAFASWLSEHKLTAQHVTDVELGTLPASVLARYPTIVFEGHTEYYERTTYDKVLRYRNAGGRLYFLQGNSFYGAAQVGTSSIYRASYRYRTAARSDFAIAATGFRSCCWPATIRPVYRISSGVVAALPWLFSGTGLRDGDQFGIALGEVDTVDAKLSPPGTITVATATVPAFTPSRERNAYAWIGDHKIPYPPAWKRPQTIAIAYARTGNGEVFSWGNTGFLKSVVSAGYRVPPAQRAALDRAALNVWERFTR